MRLVAAFIEICRTLNALVVGHLIRRAASSDYILCGIWFFRWHSVENFAQAGAGETSWAILFIHGSRVATPADIHARRFDVSKWSVR